MATSIFHITEPSLWELALADGSYERSTRDAALAQVGFIHCSFRHQVETVANYVYDDWPGSLLLLELDPDRISAEIRLENLDGGSEDFPHVYGPLPTTAVRAVHEMRRRDGTWQLPAET